MPSAKVRFGGFELDVAAGRLLRRGIPIKLQPQPLRVLLLLTDRPGQIVTREEIQRCLWGDSTFVDFERGINFSINQIRCILGDDVKRPRYIETLPRIGYRFIAPIASEALTETPIVTAASDSTGPVCELQSEPNPNSVAGSEGEDTSSWQVSRARRGYGLAAAVAGFGFLGVLSYGAYRFLSRGSDLDVRNLQITRLTDSGSVGRVAISPDGRYVAYAQYDGDNKASLWLREVSKRNVVELLPPGASLHGITISPDGKNIYFVRADAKDFSFKYLYSMPVQGGAVRKLITDVDSPVTFSPDGRRFAYEHCVQPRNDIELKIANADGSDDHLLATIHDGSSIISQPGPNWSPDGRAIAVPVLTTSQHREWVLEIVSTGDGSIRKLYSSPRAIGRPVWLTAGSALMFPQLDLANRSQLWILSLTGKLNRFTNDLFDYGSADYQGVKIAGDLDMTKDGRTIVTVGNTVDSDVWIGPAADPSAIQQVTSNGQAISFITEAFDGKLLSVGADGKLWMMNTDGSQRVLFADFEDVRSPASCGRFVIFRASKTDTLALIRVDRDGTHPVEIARGNLWSPLCSPDGKFVFYATAEQPQRIWKVPITGGVPSYISDALGDALATRLAISPDGRLLAYQYTQYGRVPSEGLKLAVFPIDGGAPLKPPDLPVDLFCLRWSPNGKSLDYLLWKDGTTNLWEQPLAGGKPKQATRFTSGEIFDFNWSLDHTRVFMTRGNFYSDVVLLRNLH